MKRLLPVILALALTPSAVAAGEREVDYIDTISRDANLALQAVMDDPVTPPACRGYADGMLTVLGLLDDVAQRPDSAFLPQLLTLMLRPLAVARYDCLTAT